MAVDSRPVSKSAGWSGRARMSASNEEPEDVPYRDLRSFIDDLDARGQLKRVAVEVDPILEISTVADRMSREPAAADAPPPVECNYPTHRRIHS